MASANKGDTVKIHYTGRLSDGTVFDSSRDGEPLEFTLGEGMVIDGFEQGVAGMQVGDQKTIEIQPDDAYGQHNADYVRSVPREEIKLGVEPEVGMELELRTPGGESIPIRVTEVDEENVTLDANHPLAGQTLTFDIERVE